MIKLKSQGTIEQDREIFKQMTFGDTQPSPKDTRDFIACAGAPLEFPEEYLAPETEILNQGSIGSCCAHACATAISQGEENQVQKHNEYSRGYIYGNRRDTDAQGEGMVIRQALKNLNHCGDVLYADFPYNKTYPEVKKLIEADKEALAEKALPHAIIDYFRCYNEEQIKQAIMEKGGVVICVPVYSEFGRDLHVPGEKEELEGYHAMVIVGWNKNKQWIVQNSWGKLWGYKGKLLMDFDYPVAEYWGITVKSDGIEPDKKSWFEKICEFISYIAKYIYDLFTKN